MKATVYSATVLVFLFVVLRFSDAWSGHFETIRRTRTYRTRYCASHFWGSCVTWRYYDAFEYYLDYRCSSGWTHNGNQNCNIALCYPQCTNGGNCESPNWCNCPEGFYGPTTGCAFSSDTDTP